MALKIIGASDVIVGHQIPEEVSSSEVEITFASSFSSNLDHWVCNGGTSVRFAKDTDVYISV